MPGYSASQRLLLAYLAQIARWAHPDELPPGCGAGQPGGGVETLVRAGRVLRDAQGRLAAGRMETAERAALAAELRAVREPSILEYCLGRLAPDTDLDDCKAAIRYLDERLSGDAEEVMPGLNLVLDFLLCRTVSPAEHAHYVELVVVVLVMCVFRSRLLHKADRLSDRAYVLSARHGNTRFQSIIAIQRCYLRTFIEGDVSGDVLQFMETLSELKHFDDRDMRDLVPYFEGLLHFVRGEYAAVLDCYERRPELSDWKYHRLADTLAFCACRAAFMRQRFPVALGMCLSARQTASLSGDSMLVRFWQLHAAFAFLRGGELDLALQHADVLFICTPPELNAKIYVGAVRTIATIHYLYGRIASAERLLRRETRTADGKNVVRPPFEDPLTLDMLLAIEQAGFPPLPWYELDTLLPRLCNSPNRVMRSAAQRVTALRLGGRRVAQAVRLLRASLRDAGEVQDVRERTLSAFVLAGILEQGGKTAEAAELRREVCAVLGNVCTEGITLGALNLRLLRYRPPVGGAETAREADAVSVAERGGRALIERCEAAIRTLPVEEKPAIMLGCLLRSVQMSLGAERALLFMPGADGQPVRAAAVNLSEDEAGQVDIRALSSSFAAPDNRTPCLALGGGTVLVLRVEEGPCWGLYLDNPHGSGDYLRLTAADWRELAVLLGAELRALNRLRMVRQTIAHTQHARMQAVTSQEDKDMLPVLGPGLDTVMEQVRRVADTTAPVLLLGETGVGKEVMARRIHQLSGRVGAFVAVHPASVAELLFESEFFGHEKGAFTGAVNQKIGLIEMADEGTLFIDEVGDVPPSIQTRLLRVLQEQAFRRVGGTRVLRSRFRLLTATNKDLGQEVRAGRFREDLLYRISVVPLNIPPLRRRREDILPLAESLAAHFCHRYNLPPLVFSEQERDCLLHYDWPGNVREMKNLLERAVILHDMSAISVLGAPEEKAVPDWFADLPDLDELEARYLRYVLKKTGGRVRGPAGAETLLRIKRSTLYAKLKRHNVSPGSR